MIPAQLPISSWQVLIVLIFSAFSYDFAHRVNNVLAGKALRGRMACLNLKVLRTHIRMIRMTWSSIRKRLSRQHCATKNFLGHRSNITDSQINWWHWSVTRIDWQYLVFQQLTHDFPPLTQVIICSTAPKNAEAADGAGAFASAACPSFVTQWCQWCQYNKAEIRLMLNSYELFDHPDVCWVRRNQQIMRFSASIIPRCLDLLGSDSAISQKCQSGSFHCWIVRHRKSLTHQLLGWPGLVCDHNEATYRMVEGLWMAAWSFYESQPVG